jgi:hypothetical protein
MRRVFDLDVLLCTRGGRRRRIVAVYPGGLACTISWTDSGSARLRASRPPGVPCSPHGRQKPPYRLRSTRAALIQW